jgi:hypothetical protein
VSRANGKAKTEGWHVLCSCNLDQLDTLQARCLQEFDLWLDQQIERDFKHE